MRIFRKFIILQFGFGMLLIVGVLLLKRRQIVEEVLSTKRAPTTVRDKSSENLNIVTTTPARETTVNIIIPPDTGLKGETYASYIKPRKKGVFFFDFETLVKPQSVCSKQKNPYLLILIISHPGNLNKRNAIRRNWGSMARTQKWPNITKTFDEKVELVFVFGGAGNSSANEALRNESREHGDILQVNFVDNYYNLTLKVLMGFRWMSRDCRLAEFVVKADDDVFLNLPLLIDYLGKTDLNNSILGYTIFKSPVLRWGKNSVSKEAFPFKYYPPYNSGCLYVLPSSLATSIVYVSKYIPYSNNEDVHITGILGNIVKADLKSLNTKGWYDPYHRPGVCDFVTNKKLYGQQVDSNFSDAIWRTYHNETLCKDKKFKT